jgi:DHA2 family multidrug resistance protein
VLQTFLTKREQFHSDVLTSQVSLLGQTTRERLEALAHRIMVHGVSDPAYAHREAAVALGGLVRRQAYMLAFSDTIILQSILLGLALFSVLLLRKAKSGSSGEAH